MERDLFKHLEDWKVKSRRKPLIVMGARQVGKTYLLKKFAKAKFKNFVYFNFEENPKLTRVFEGSLKPEEILKNLTVETKTKIVPGQTLLFFDEIQECPNALNSLKYFCENAPEYHICAAGSLLGVKLIHTKGFPVGKVDFLHLYPLGFFEFLKAIGEKELLTSVNDQKNISSLSSFIHDKLIRLFKIYMFVGGMPEAVLNYIETKDFAKVSEVHQAILNAYSLDFAKHAPKEELMKITRVWDSIPGQLAKENKKFIYSTVRKGARAKDYEVALQWLSEAGLIHKVTNVSTPKLPLEGYANFDFFKLYLLDIGLLGAMSSLSPRAVIDGDVLFQEFKGALVENYVAQELAYNGYKLYYWTSEGKAEVDFVIQHNDFIYPLEVKSGNSSKKQSLRVYGEQYKPNVLIRTSPMNLRKDGKVLNCPLYFLKNLKIFLNEI